MAVIASYTAPGRAYMLIGFRERATKLRCIHRPIGGGSPTNIDKDITWDDVNIGDSYVELDGDVIFEIPAGREVIGVEGRNTTNEEQAYTVTGILEEFPNGGNFIVQNIKAVVSNA